MWYYSYAILVLLRYYHCTQSIVLVYTFFDEKFSEDLKIYNPVLGLRSVKYSF